MGAGVAIGAPASLSEGELRGGSNWAWQGATLARPLIRQTSARVKKGGQRDAVDGHREKATRVTEGAPSGSSPAMRAKRRTVSMQNGRF